MEPLQAVDQHRAVGLLEHVSAHLDLIIRPDRQQVRIEGGMMQRAEGDAVRHRRRAKRFTVANDVSGLQELIVPETNRSRNDAGTLRSTRSRNSCWCSRCCTVRVT